MINSTAEHSLHALRNARHVDGHAHTAVGGYTVTIDFEHEADGIAAEHAIEVYRQELLGQVPRRDMRTFTGPGHLEQTGYIPPGSSAERDRASNNSTRAHLPRVRVVRRPLLTSGMLATAHDDVVILIDSEQDARQQSIAFWHEVVHLLVGAADEAAIDAVAERLATAVPDLPAALGAPAPHQEDQG